MECRGDVSRAEKPCLGKCCPYTSSQHCQESQEVQYLEASSFTDAFDCFAGRMAWLPRQWPGKPNRKQSRKALKHLGKQSPVSILCMSRYFGQKPHIFHTSTKKKFNSSRGIILLEKFANLLYFNSISQKQLSYPICEYYISSKVNESYVKKKICLSTCCGLQSETERGHLHLSSFLS